MDGFLGRQAFAFYAVRGNCGVNRFALQEACLRVFPRGEIRARRRCGIKRLQPATLIKGRKRRGEQDYGGVCGGSQQRNVRRRLHGTSAERHYSLRCLKRRCQRLVLVLPESRLSIFCKNSWNPFSRALFDKHVEIDKRISEPLGEQSTDGGFARTHEAGENDACGVGHSSQCTERIRKRRSPRAAPFLV